MQITPELIAEARRFHELGGNEGYKIQRGDWYFYSDGCGISSGKVNLCNDVPGISASYCIPIHDAEYLWGWLRKHWPNYLRCAYNGNFWGWFHYYAKTTGMCDDNIDLCLYSAANWILEQEKAK